VCFASVKVDIGCLAGFCEDGLAVGEACQRRSVEAGEGVEWVALDIAAGNCCVQEPEIKAAVVADENGTFAAG
jgi:hypothetical protein